MKSYYQYMSEILPDELFEGLLGYGLFAEKLPGVFSGESFLAYCNTHNCNFNHKGHDYVRYNAMRNTGITRQMAIPNPISYYCMCDFLRNNWETNLLPYFYAKTSGQSFCYSQVHLQKIDADKALFHMNLDYAEKDSVLDDYCITLPIAKRYKVTTDISNCFPSIYSHALSWALTTKEVAKLTKNDKTLWYNQLDDVNINLKNRETNGQLIGPHTSNLISEIILTSVDAALQDRYKYIRKIDDITFYADTYQEAEDFINDLSKELKNYDLLINEKKTKIEELPEKTDDWLIQLNWFYIGDEKTTDGKRVFRRSRLIPFLNLATKLADESGNLSVYLYAIKIISSTCLGRKAKIYYISILRQLLMKYTYLVHSMDDFVFSKFTVSNDEIKEIAKELYEFSIKKRNYEACSFALYWSLKYNFSIGISDLYNDAISSNDCVFLLLAYLITKRSGRKNEIRQYKQYAKTIIDIDRYWYFIYETVSLPDLPDLEMRRLKRQKVSFLRDEYR